MKRHQLKLAPMAAAIILLSAAGSANAGAYAYSFDHIFGFTIGNPTGKATATTSTSTSTTSALMSTPPAAPPPATPGFAPLNAPQAFVGSLGASPPPEDTFAPQGPTAFSYSRADARIFSTQFPSFPAGSTSIEAANVAEAHLATTGTASAIAKNGSTTGVTVDFSVASPTATLSFDFQANPYMSVFLHPSVGPGSSATAGLSLVFTITDALGNIVFNWAPNGVVDTGIVGGIENPGGDSANLNINLPITPPSVGPFIYDPTGCGAPTDPVQGTTCGVNFSALTNDLIAGDYTLTLNMLESVDIDAVKVPEPGTLSLLALGLAGLGVTRRRKAG